MPCHVAVIFSPPIKEEDDAEGHHSYRQKSQGYLPVGLIQIEPLPEYHITPN